MPKEETENYKHLRVRSPRAFSKFRVVKPSHADKKDLAFAKKKAHVRRLPRGTKVTVGKLKKKAKVAGAEALKGRRVKRRRWAIQKLMVPK